MFGPISSQIPHIFYTTLTHTHTHTHTHTQSSGLATGRQAAPCPLSPEAVDDDFSGEGGVEVCAGVCFVQGVVCEEAGAVGIPAREQQVLHLQLGPLPVLLPGEVVELHTLRRGHLIATCWMGGTNVNKRRPVKLYDFSYVDFYNLTVLILFKLLFFLI